MPEPGRPLAGLVAALTVAGQEHVVALEAALLARLTPRTVQLLAQPLPGDEGDVVLLELQLEEAGAAARGRRFTPGRYRRGCLRPLERALAGERYAPEVALKGLRVSTITVA